MSRRPYRWWIGGFIIALLAVTAIGLLAGNPPDEDRAHALEQRLRCPTCKSVSIAESPSETAAGMRQIVAEQVADGRSDQQILKYFKDRYGQWVLLDPPARGQTLLLWVLPIVAGGAGIIVLVTRAKQSPSDPGELPEADRSRIQSALHEYRTQTQDDDEP